MKLVLTDKTEYETMSFASLNNIPVIIENYADMEKLETDLRKTGNLKNISVIDEETENEYQYTDLKIVDPIFNMAQKTSDNKVLVSFGIRKMTEEEKKMEEMEQQQEAQSENITLAISYLSDEEALTVKNLYPSFDELVEGAYTAKEQGFRFRDGEDLYKTAQDNVTFQEQYRPREGTESLYTHIDEGHAGTVEDPIPAVTNMEYEYGKYYIENNVIYICKRGGVANPEEMYGQKITLQYLPSQLVGQYFEIGLPQSRWL